MAMIKDLLANKRKQVLAIGPEATVLDAALLMNEHKVGSLVVLEDGRLAGIITERDILTRVVAGRREPGATRVGEVMIADVRCGRLCRRGSRQPRARRLGQELRSCDQLLQGPAQERSDSPEADVLRPRRLGRDADPVRL